MPALLFVLKYWRVLAAVVGIVGLLGGAGIYVAKIKHDAYVAGYEAARAKCEQEKAAQEAANRKVMEEATKALDELTKTLELKDVQLDDYLKAIDLASDAAPDAANECLSGAAVKRLARIE